MALVPGRQFQPSTFHGTRLTFFRYASSLPRRNSRLLCSSELNPTSTSSSTRKPLPRISNWIDRWSDKKKQVRSKYPRIAVNYRRNSGHLQNMGFAESDSSSGSGGGTTMQRIVDKLKKFGYMDDNEDDAERRRQSMSDRVKIEKGSVEDIFYVEEGLLPNTAGGFSPESPFGDRNPIRSDDGEVKFPWEKKDEEEEEGAKWTARGKSKTSVAELTLPDAELRRLRLLTFQAKQKVRIKGAGVTQDVVNKIHEVWRRSEIVRLKIEGAAALNMKRVHEILERKTGGLVVWRSGTAISLYRGVSYEDPYSMKLNKRIPSGVIEGASLPEQTNVDATATIVDDITESPPEVEYEDEMDNFLGSLGPRYQEWPGCDPLPVDADMLPGIVPGFQPPFRVLPYGVRATLSQKDATALRRLARVLPPHFAVGRSRQLQGLAKAIIKFWERSSIAKVALKRGVQLTTSERMAEDIKRLTGGVLLSRNKDFLIFYRGKNFLSPDVTDALLERERLAQSFQDEEEQARLRASALVMPIIETTEQQGNTGTLEETMDANAKWAQNLDEHHKQKVSREAEIARHADLVRKLEKKLLLAERKLVRAEKALRKVEEFLQPAKRQADPESITDEERFMFRKIGLRMKAFLLLGRRGVFDGTVENMHLHWKYRELVKIIVKATFDQVKKIALALEAESGGVLVSVDKVSKGYAIIVFRGKDYERPTSLRPKNLLTKRKALARSIELQRREALLSHVTAMQNKVGKLRSEIEKMENVKDEGDGMLYDILDSAYASDDDDDEEEEGEDAYLETYKGESDLLEEEEEEEEEEEASSGRLNVHAFDDVQLDHPVLD